MPRRRTLQLAAVVLIGVLLRLLLAFPVYRYVAEADALLGPITARAVLEGEWPIFLTPARHGALGGYLMAGLFLLVGESRVAIHLHPFLIQLVTMAVWWAFCRELLGRWNAPGVAACIALAPPAVLFWTSMPNPYPEVLLCCAAILWLGARALHRPGWGSTAWLGLAIGVGFWMSIQTLCCTIPVVLVLLLRKPRVPLREIALGVTVALFGSLPWWLAQIGPREGRLSANFAASPSRLDQIGDNLLYLATSNIPELLASGGVAGPAVGPTPQWMWMRWLLIMLLGGLAAWGGFRGWRGAGPGRTAVALSLLVLFWVVVLNVLSSAGASRALTVRYVMPAILVLPVLIALGLAALPRLSRELGLLVSLGLVSWNLVTLPLPGTADRRAWTLQLEEQTEWVREALEEAGIDVVFGSYWVVYPLNYLSRSVRGLSCSIGDDILRFWASTAITPSSRIALSSGFSPGPQFAAAGIEIERQVATRGTLGDWTFGRGTELDLLAVNDRLCRRQDPGPQLFGDGFESGDAAAWSEVTSASPRSPAGGTADGTWP